MHIFSLYVQMSKVRNITLKCGDSLRTELLPKNFLNVEVEEFVDDSITFDENVDSLYSNNTRKSENEITNIFLDSIMIEQNKYFENISNARQTFLDNLTPARKMDFLFKNAVTFSQKKI